MKTQEKAVRRWLEACIGLMALCITFTGCALTAPVVFESETLEKCQKGIESEAPKFEKKVFGALKKCKEFYRAAVTDGDPLAEAATKCDAALTKVLLFPDIEDKSALAKAKIKLDSFTDPAKLKCSDQDLVALGHLPTGTFGDLWARLTLVRRINAAVAGQITAIRDTPDILAALAAAGCTRCGALAAPPCFDATCQLSGSTVVELLATAIGPFTGNVNVSICRNTALLGSDLGLFAEPAKGVVPEFLGAGFGQTICTSAIGGQGYIAGPGSLLDHINTEGCQDHMNGDGDECPAALAPEVPICAATAADPHAGHAGTTNAGACMAFADSAAVTGDAFLMGSLRLSYACDGHVNCGGVNTHGADGIACTSDDTAPQGPTFIFPLTTGTADSAVLDANNMNGMTVSTSGPFTGLVFDANAASAGDLSAGRLVASVPGLHALIDTPPEDTALSVSLDCQ